MKIPSFINKSHRKNKFYGLLGPTNCGKTTLMRAISQEKVEGFPKQDELVTIFVEHDVAETEIEPPSKEWPTGKMNIDLTGCLCVRCGEPALWFFYSRPIQHMPNKKAIGPPPPNTLQMLDFILPVPSPHSPQCIAGRLFGDTCLISCKMASDQVMVFCENMK